MKRVRVEAPRYLIHDRDHAFDGLKATAKAMGIEGSGHGPACPVAKSVRRAICDLRAASVSITVIAFNEAGVRKLMRHYCSYCEKTRTHLALDKDGPVPRPVMRAADGDIVTIPKVGGLHHRYERRAA